MSLEFQNQSSIIPHDIVQSLVERRGSIPKPAIQIDRLDMLRATSLGASRQVDHLLTLANKGLPRMHKGCVFGHTLRAIRTKAGETEQLQGRSLRYQAMVALGLSGTTDMTQRQILEGTTAAALAETTAMDAAVSPDLGAVSLAAWACGEVAGIYAAPLFRRIAERLASDTPCATVECAWALIAALAARELGDVEDVITLAATRLMVGRAKSGLFTHTLPPSAGGYMRAHIGCFADQVYPIQALARLYVADGGDGILAAAEACAERICALQGPAGQWWWHYDTRDGSVVEGYPVYSVHQHAMGPMALLELREAGGTDYTQAVIKGLGWLNEHPETPKSLVCFEKGVVWRKVARHEPNKMIRIVSAATTGLARGWKLPGIDTLFPPGVIDYECRPYELGWLLYAWLSGGTVAALAARRKSGTQRLPKDL